MPRFTGVEFGFENEHKAKPHPAPAKTHLKAVPSKRYASLEDKGDLLAAAVIAALVLIAAKFFAV